VSLNKAARQLPQYCTWHRRFFPHEKWRAYSASEGRFVKNNSLFVCQRCLQKDRTFKPRPHSPIEVTVAQELKRRNYDFRSQFEIGDFVYDFAFPRFKILLDVDGKSCHKKPPTGFHTPGSRENTAKVNGWRLIHVRNDPRLVERAIQAVCEAISS
jgi:very-short-patch-repair endonuclease